MTPCVISGRGDRAGNARFKKNAQGIPGKTPGMLGPFNMLPWLLPQHPSWVCSWGVLGTRVLWSLQWVPFPSLLGLKVSGMHFRSLQIIYTILLVYYICITEERGYYGSYMVIVRAHRDFLVFNLLATFLVECLLNFASALLWQRSGHTILLVAQESKLCSGKSKTSKILIIACVQAVGHSFIFIFCA